MGWQRILPPHTDDIQLPAKEPDYRLSSRRSYAAERELGNETTEDVVVALRYLLFDINTCRCQMTAFLKPSHTTFSGQPTDSCNYLL